MIKLAFIFNQNKIWGKLTKYFTGCYCYHVAWVDTDTNLMYDIHLVRRRRKFPGSYKEDEVILSDVHFNVTREYLEDKLSTDNTLYGWRDYTLFALRPLFHLFGKSTPNIDGVICSELINNDIWETGTKTLWTPQDPPPSPCDLYKQFK